MSERSDTVLSVISAQACIAHASRVIPMLLPLLLRIHYPNCASQLKNDDIAAPNVNFNRRAEPRGRTVALEGQGLSSPLLALLRAVGLIFN